MEGLTITLSNGKQVRMTTENWSEKAVYIKELYVNGRKYDKSYLPYDVVREGASLRFVMSEKPVYKRGVSESDLPPSVSLPGNTRLYRSER